ncbi:MAG: acetylornithine deacetylase [Fimbriimonadaceae bacterium]|nr:acetylornithine deacetylase [Alphaproteobacteria bacterium]
MARPTYTTIEMLEKLIGFDTTSSKSNMDLIRFVRDYLGAHGIECHVIANEDESKANLFASIGPSSGGGIGLSGHTDVVPAHSEDWTGDPFILRHHDDKVFGRGACDMKGFIAAVLAMVPEFSAANLSAPIHFLWSYDEEVGCTGVRPMVDQLGRQLARPDLIIVGEPTEMRIVDAHKSANSITTEIRGVEAHSSLPHLGVSAIFAAGQVLQEIARIRDEMMEKRDPSGRFNPPFTTVGVGMMSGGNAKNIVPRDSEIHWEFRGLPDLDPNVIPARIQAFGEQTILPALRAISPDTWIRTKVTNAVPGLKPEPGGKAEQLATAILRANDTATVSFCTEAGLFQGVGIPTVICGPGSIEQAHKPDEFVTLSELEACTAFLRGIVRQLSA